MSPSYIGIDAHVKFCQCCVINTKGEPLLNVQVPTEPKALRTFMHGIRKPRHAIAEMSAMSEWLVRTLEPDVNEIIICDARKNRWICGSDDSTDEEDAFKLAQMLRGNFYSAVHVPVEDRQRFKETVQDYHRLTQEMVRVKNRIKAKYRARGLRCAGDSIYSSSQREKWLIKIEPASRRTTLLAYYRMLDTLEEERGRLLQRLRSASKDYPEIRLLQTVPGVGFIVAMTFFSLVDTPYRFQDKEHLWSYARLGRKEKISAGRIKGGGQKGGNRLLKSMLMEASHVAVNKCKKNREFEFGYKKLIERGLDQRVATRTIARRICSILYGIWKSREPYRIPNKSEQDGVKSVPLN